MTLFGLVDYFNRIASGSAKFFWIKYSPSHNQQKLHGPNNIYGSTFSVDYMFEPDQKSFQAFTSLVCDMKQNFSGHVSEKQKHFPSIYQFL